MSETKLYRPPNGSEGDGFMSQHCFQCVHEKWTHTMKDSDKKCDIMSRSILFDIKDEEYPKEWIYQEDKPTCTAFKFHEWIKEGEIVEPVEPEPVDPNQIKLF